MMHHTPKSDFRHSGR